MHAPPQSLWNQPKIDTHCHLFDPVNFPYADDVAYRPAGHEIAPASYFLRVMEAYGVSHAVLVQPNSGYNADNRCMLAAIAASGGRFKGIAIVPPNATDNELLALKDQGVVGVAHNMAMLGLDAYAEHDTFWQRLAKLGVMVQVQVMGDQLGEPHAKGTLAQRLLASQATVLVDHQGRPDLSQGLAAPGFQALLGMAASGRVYVKLSGYDKFSTTGYPFADTLPHTQALLARFGPSRCLWASDWPHLRAKQRMDYGVLLHLFEQSVPDPRDQAQVLYDTPKRLFGF